MTPSAKSPAPRRITPEEPPVFPCWIWTKCVRKQGFWQRVHSLRLWDADRFGGRSCVCTHWVEQLDAPTYDPTPLPPSSPQAALGANRPDEMGTSFVLENLRRQQLDLQSMEHFEEAAVIAQAVRLIERSLAAPVPAGGETMVAWLENMVRVNQQLHDAENPGTHAKEKFRNYVSAYSSALTAAKNRFAPPDLTAEVARLQKAKIDACIAWTDVCDQLSAAQAENEKLVKERDEILKQHDNICIDLGAERDAARARLTSLEAALPGVVEALENIRAKTAIAGYDSGDSGVYHIVVPALSTLRALLSGKEGETK